MKINTISLLLILVISLYPAISFAQEPMPPSALLPAKNPNPYNGKDKRYTLDGKIDTITHYRKGQMVRYRNYFRDGGLFQDFSYRNGAYHGRHLEYNEVSETVFKGRMRNDLPFSGQFDEWDEEVKEYRILTYKKGKVTCNRLLSEIFPETKTANQTNQ